MTQIPYTAPPSPRGGVNPKPAFAGRFAALRED